MLRSIFRRLTKALLWFAGGSVLLVLVFRFVPPPGTALMVERKVESWVDGEPIDLQRTWKPWNEISDDLKVAVIGASICARSRRRWPTTNWAVRFVAPAP
jgi:monofunctional biosynthetic peptidoglycan transglycosylase